MLLDMFPDAQFIHVLRDGRDAAVSLFKVGVGPNNVYEAAVGWRKSVNTVWTFAERLSREQFFEVRYDRLLQDSVNAMTDVGRFLGVEEPDMVGAASAQVLRDCIHGNGAVNWPTQLTQREIECFEAVAGAELQRGGFAPMAERPPRRLSRTASLIWRLDGAFHRVRRTTHWRELHSA